MIHKALAGVTHLPPRCGGDTQLFVGAVEPALELEPCMHLYVRRTSALLNRWQLRSAVAAVGWGGVLETAFGAASCDLNYQLMSNLAEALPSIRALPGQPQASRLKAGSNPTNARKKGSDPRLQLVATSVSPRWASHCGGSPAARRSYH